MRGARRAGFAWLAMGLALLGCEARQDPADAPVEPWPEGALVAAALPAPQRAIVVAADGTIHVGDPGAGRFRRAHVPAVERLAALAMADATFGWAVGDGVVLRTEDGGERWQRQRLPGRAAEHRLVSVGAASPDVAIAIDDRGRLITTRDGGAVWTVWPIPPHDEVWTVWPIRPHDGGVPGASRTGRVVCASGAALPCLAVGVSGRAGVLALDPVKREVETLAMAPPAELPPIAFRAGGSEPDAAGLEALVAAAKRLAGRSVDWMIDVRITLAEIERATVEQDPGVLFDLIEGRGEEIALRLEAAGVETDRVALLAPPPWGFEDLIDDDPEILERYWRGRRDGRPSAVVETRWRLRFEGLAIDAAGDAAIASAGPAATFWRPDSEVPLEPVAGPGRARVRAFARGAAGWVAAGEQGALWTAPVDPGTQTPPRAWREADVAESGPFFDTLHGVGSGLGGSAVLVVGDGGRLLWSEDGGVSWRALARPTSSTKAQVPIIR